MNEHKKEIPGISPASIKKELLNFKDDILKDIRSVQFSLDNKYLKADELIKQKLIEYELKLNSFNQKIGELSNQIFTDKSIKEKVESLNEFKEEMKDIIFKRRAKYNEFETQVNNDINRINDILLNSVIYPGIIGKSTNFLNFHEFIDYVLQEIAHLVIFKDKSGLDIAPFKRKIEQTLEAFKIQISNLSSKEYANSLNNQTEERIKSILKIYDDRLMDIRVENSQFTFGFKKKIEEIGNQMGILQKMQKNINKKIENQYNEDIFNEYNNEFNLINIKINNMNKIIKELLSYHSSSTINLINEERRPSKVYSGVKQYIKGNLNASELSSMKKFTVQKSGKKGFDQSFQSPSISFFPAPDFLNINDNQKSYSNNHSDKIKFMNFYSINTSDNDILNKSKKLLMRQTLNFTNKSNSFHHNYNDIESNDINKFDQTENIPFKRRTFFKKKTYFNDKANMIESSKINKEVINENSSSRSKTIRLNKNIIEEKNKLNNFNINDKNHSYQNIKEDNNKKNKFDINILEDNANKEKGAAINPFIIKEEDENIFSENSYKNLDLYSERDNNDKNNSSLKIDNKDFNKEDNNKINPLININKEQKNIITNSKNEKIKSVQKPVYSVSDSEKNNIKTLSIKKKVDSNEPENNIHEKLNNFDENVKNYLNKNKLLKNDSPKNVHSLKNINENIAKENSNNKGVISKNEIRKYPKSGNALEKNHIYKSPQNPNYCILENDKKNIRKNHQNNIIPNIQIQSINKANRTYTSFPKINKELVVNKIVHNDYNYFEPKEINLNEISLIAKYVNQGKRVAAFVSKPKKVLLTNPDNIPPNSIIRRKRGKNFINKNFLGNQSEKGTRIKKYEKIYNNNNNQYFIPSYLKSKEEDKYKSLKNLKVNKNPLK